LRVENKDFSKTGSGGKINIYDSGKVVIGIGGEFYASQT